LFEYKPYFIQSAKLDLSVFLNMVHCRRKVLVCNINSAEIDWYLQEINIRASEVGKFQITFGVHHWSIPSHHLATVKI
jgi:hypothetical protein